MTAGLRLPPLLLAAVVLHTAVLPQFRVFGVAVDVLLLLAVTAGLAGGPDRGAAVGFVAGLLADLFLQTPFGLSALVYCLVAWGVGRFQTTILHAAWWIPMLTTVVAASAGVLLFAVVGSVLGETHLLSGDLVRIVAVVAVGDALLAPLGLRALRWAFAADSGRLPALAR